MSTVLRLSTCLLIATVLVACNKSAAPDAGVTGSTSAPAPQAAPSAAPATPPAPTAAPVDDTAAVALDMGKVKAWMQAQKNLAVLEKADPKLDAAQNVSEENVTQYAARLEADAKMHAAIEEAGLSTRDFARIGDTLIGALMTQAALEGGQLKKIPDGIDPASVEFVKQHKAEINGLMTGAGAG